MAKFRQYDKYEVYEDGRIWSYSRKKFLKPTTNQYGYQIVSLSDNEGKIKKYQVHRVVWEAVTGEQIPKGYEINHISEVKTSNIITNLELISHRQNNNYGSRTSRAAEALSKQVGAFKDGKLVLVFNSTNEAGRNGFNKGAVAACCRNCFHREGNNVYKGFEWRYI